MSIKSVRLPADVAADIEQMAKDFGTTPEKQTEALLRFSLGNFPRRESLLDAARRISAMTPKGVKQTPAEVLVREIRDQ